MKRIGMGVSYAILTVLLMAACTSRDKAPPAGGAPGGAAPPGGAPAARGEPKGTLRVIGDLQKERWVLRTNSNEAPMSVIGEPLVWWDWDKDIPTNGAILESFQSTVNADNSQDWVFKIKKGVKFHKGYGDVTADDIKFTLEQFIQPGSINSNAAYFTRFFGKDPKNLVVVDPYTLKIHTPEVMNTVELFRTFGPDDGGRTLRPFSKKYFEEVGEDAFGRNPVYAGPYEFVSLVPGYSVTVKAVKDHYRVKPGFAEIVYLSVKDEATIIAMLKTGEVDMASVPHRLVPDLQKSALKIAYAKNAAEPFIGLGGLYPTRSQYDPTVPWAGKDPMSENSIKVRKALSLAVDRKALLDKIFFGQGELGALSFSFINSSMPWWNPAWVPDPYDPAQAKKLMAEAGYPNCFAFRFWMQTGSVYALDVGEAVAAMWEKNLGCKIERRVADYQPHIRGMLEKRTAFHDVWFFQGGPIVRPTRYACLHGAPTYAAVVHSELPYFTDFCKKLDHETNLERQVKTERELGDIVYKSYPTIPLASIHTAEAVGPKVGSWDAVSSRKGPMAFLELVNPK